MKVYIESNFVLELALLQEQNESCENILSLGKSGNIHLIIPAFCVAEPIETLVRRAINRRKRVWPLLKRKCSKNSDLFLIQQMNYPAAELRGIGTQHNSNSNC